MTRETQIDLVEDAQGDYYDYEVVDTDTPNEIVVATNTESEDLENISWFDYVDNIKHNLPDGWTVSVDAAEESIFEEFGDDYPDSDFMVFKFSQLA